jgi:hypothetical protein
MRRQVFVFIVVMLSALTTVAHASVMLGAFVAGNGWKQENILSLNEQLHKELSFITLFSAFTEDWDQLYWQTRKVASAGMVPMISWMPIDQNRKETNILPEIVAGQWDAYLIEWSERFIAWRNSYDKGQRPDIMLRFGHEFNGNWYSYSDSPELYKDAWRYIHKLFETQGVNEYIEWVWCANNLNIDSVNDITRYYPGDEFVDWTSIDGYNWGTNYSWTSWETFTEVYADMYSTMVSNYPDKPIVIAEYGSAEPADVPDPVWGQNGDDSDFNEDKDAWVRDMLVVLEENLPAIRAVSLFNINKELGWSITDAGNTGLAGMNHGLVSDYFVSTYIAARGDRRRIAEGPDSTGNTNPSEPPIAYAYDSDFFRAQEQQRRAQSRALPQINRDSVERMRQGFLSMSPQGRARLKDLKLSVLNGG